MEFSEQVLFLHLGKFKEADVWVRFLSPTRGLLTAFAFGGVRSRNRFIGCLDIFNEVDVKITSSGRGSYLALHEGILVKGLSRLRTDTLRLGMAANCSSFLQTFGVFPEGAEAAHFLMVQTLRLLEEKDSPPKLLPIFFRARLAFDQGYALDTQRCGICGQGLGQQHARLLLNDGQLACPHCAHPHMGQQIPCGPQARELLSRIHALSPLDWDALPSSQQAARECARLIDGFVHYHMGIRWENSRFVRR